MDGLPSFRLLVEKMGVVALALDELHRRPVLHRDLKPEHLRIREPGGTPVLFDFGVGHYAGAATITTSGLPPGTRNLRSPEALRFMDRHSRRLGPETGARATRRCSSSADSAPETRYKKERFPKC